MPVLNKPPNRRFQFSLRALFGVMTLSAFVLALIVPGPIRAVARQLVRARLSEYGVYISMHEVREHITVGRARITESEFNPLMPSIARWFRVRKVGFTGSGLGDAATSELYRFGDDLEELSFADTRVTDEGLRALADLGYLIRIDLTNTAVTDEGLEILSAHTRLGSLQLTGTKITDQGMTHLSHLSELSVLTMARTAVSDAGLAHLEGLTNLDELDLDDTGVSDAGLAHLKRLARLRELRLQRTGVTDAGLKSLLGHKELHFLFLDGTGVSWKGVNELREHLPQTFVFYADQVIDPWSKIGEVRSSTGP